MLKKGLYRHHHEIEYAAGSVNAGDILLEVHETKNAFVLTLLEQQVRYDAPQIDDMFQKSNRVVIRKDGSKHANDEYPPITEEELDELDEIMAILRVKDPLPPPAHTAEESWEMFKAEHAEEFARLGQLS